MKTLKVANGLVKGQVKNVLGKDVVEFISIPYCKPPIKDLRFKKPQPCDTFSNEVINKLNFETCPPWDSSFGSDSALSEISIDELTWWIPKEKQDEDCLYVNIWCPLSILEGKERRPIMVWIYGGGFVGGSSSVDSYRGDVLASHEDIIVVTFNYRVGTLGFLCLGEMELNGNLGIWDQILALKWIHDNISVFNGDPENITIFGCSAGGFSVSLHLLIEESWPHFHKAISESGVCYSDWGLRSKEESIRRSVVAVNKVLDKFQFPLRYDQSLSKTDKQKIIDFLQSVDFKEFLIDSEVSSGIFQFAWSPCVDGELIKGHPRTLVKEGKVKMCPTIILAAENEGSMILSLMGGLITTKDDEEVDENYFDQCFEYYPHFPIKCKDSTKNKIKHEYNIQQGGISIHVLDKIFSDRYFNCDSIDFTSDLSRWNRHVYYLWHRNFIPMSCISHLRGAHHSSEVDLIFGRPLRSSSLDSYAEISKVTMDRVGKFIKSGLLDQDLPFYDDASKSFIDIFGTNWHQEHFSDDQMRKVDFWRDLQKD